MRPLVPALVLLLLATPLAGALVSTPTIPSPLTARTQSIASGLARPLDFVDPGDGSGRMFIVEQRGLIKTWTPGGGVDPVPYLNAVSRVSQSGNERGLLGLAFYPDFETSGRLLISYTRASDGASVLERFVVADPANGKPPSTGQVLLVQSQPFSNHNGGDIEFGPDGFLYYFIGDGGSAGDPQNNAQNLNSLLGKLLRLDVSGAGGYAIPASNPYATGGGRAEIWASGLRNPWRNSFDKLTGDLWIADVGQNLYEEVNFQPASAPGGRNYGWRPWEGYNPYNPVEAARPASLTMTFPVITYDHGQGCSITGGYVYRGSAIPALQGAYVYGDYCSGRVWAAQGVMGTTQPFLLMATFHDIASFGQDASGEVYIVDLNGEIVRIVPA